MADNTKIEWTDSTVNFWWGCTKVGPGCDHCYAETWSKSYGENIWGVGTSRRKIKGAVELLHKLDNGYSWWSADHEIAGYHQTSRRRVFVQSMSDLFDMEVPVEWFAEAWQTIGRCSRLHIQIVTKRISAVEKRIQAISFHSWPKHAGLMITVCNQTEVDRDIPRLLALKEKLGIPWVGLSIEPLLGRILIPHEWLAEIDWVIVGGESGPKARPMHPDWARSIRDQCATAGAAFHFKQWGNWFPWGPQPGGNLGGDVRKGHVRIVHPSGKATEELADDLGGKCTETGSRYMAALGKKAAGRLLDGVEHNGMPGTLT